MAPHELRWTHEMNQTHRLTPPDGEDSPSDRAVLELFAREAARLSDRPGLVDRVYSASVERLPGRTPTRHTNPRLQPRIAGRVGVWRRLALAATIIIVCIAANMTPTPRRTVSPSGIALAGLFEIDSAAFDDSEVQVEHLLRFESMTFGDVTTDVDLMVADLGL